MLPKPEKISKKNPKVEQPNMVDALDNEAKIRRKRRLVFLILILTVGLSFGFWFYRSAKNIFINKNFPKINFNFSFKPNQNNNNNLEKSVNEILIKDKNFWSIIVKNLPESSTSFSWAKNDTEILANEKIADIISLLSKKDFSEQSLIKTALPSGVQIKENIISADNSFEIQDLIIVPEKQILLIIKISGTNNLSQSQKLIPQLAEKIYWNVIALH